MRLRLLPLLLICGVLIPFRSAFGVTNGLALTPPMGWNSWNYFACNVNQAIIESMADAIATNGMATAGYQFINIDDCWSTTRDANGMLVADPTKFPSGIKALAAYVHSKGLKLGIYSDHGTETCQGRPGSYGYEYLDALTFASWGVDYLKYDNCSLPANDSTNVDDTKMGNALAACGRPIVYSLCDWSFSPWMPTVGNLWRTTADINDSFSSLYDNLLNNAPMAYYAGPGAWNDPDMLEVGNGGMTATQNQSQFSLWCLLSAPLIAGNDLTNMTAQTLEILTNNEVIAVDQDPAGEQAVDAPSGSAEIWFKSLGTDFNTKAVGLFFPGGGRNATVYWTNIGLQPGLATVRDLWGHVNLGTFTNSFTTNVPSYGTAVLEIVGTAPALPVVGTNYLSTMQVAYQYTGSGTITPNKSIGGNPITLNGVAYTNGIGVNSYSGLEYQLGGVASRFQANIGVDDEVGSAGSVVFQVFADGSKIYDSGVMMGGDQQQTINVDVTGVNKLVLGVNDAQDGTTSDHADWAEVAVIVTNATPAAPWPPSGLSAESGNPVRLNWSAVPGATNYNVQRSTSSGGPFTNVASVLLPNYADSNVEAGVTYYYVVSSVGKFGESTNSAETSAEGCSAISPPTGLTVTLNGSYVILNWVPVAGATSYTVARATSSTAFTNIAFGIDGPAYTDTNRAGGTTYYYAIAADNGCAQSGYSAFAFPSNSIPITLWQAGTNMVLNWPEGVLQSSDTVNGPYSDVPGGSFPYTVPMSAAQQFYRVVMGPTN